MKTDNDLIFLGISYPLYVSTIYNMLGFEWTKALSERKTSWSNGKGKQVEQSQPYIEHQLCDLHPVYAI